MACITNIYVFICTQMSGRNTAVIISRRWGWRLGLKSPPRHFCFLETGWPWTHNCPEWWDFRYVPLCPAQEGHLKHKWQNTETAIRNKWTHWLNVTEKCVGSFRFILNQESMKSPGCLFWVLAASFTHVSAVLRRGEPDSLSIWMASLVSYKMSISKLYHLAQQGDQPWINHQWWQWA
jgi:hypothetical protein